MTEPRDEQPEVAVIATTDETAAFDDGTETTDDEPAPSPIPGVKTP